MIALNYNYHDILKMRVIRRKKSVFDAYLEKLFSHYEVDEIDRPDLCISIEDFSPDLKNCFIVDNHYFVKDGYIFYENRYKYARWRVEINGLESTQTNVRIASNSFGRMVFPGETIYSLMRYKLALKGYPLIHGSGVGLNNRGYIFSARGGTGKTITTLNLVKKGFDYYSDDSLILGRNRLFSFIVPFNLRFYYDIERLLGIHFSPGLRIEIILKKILYYLTCGKISLFTNVHARDIFENAIKDDVEISRIFLLIQGPEYSIQKNLNKDNAAKKLFLNIWFESPELIALLLAYNYVFPKSPLFDFCDSVYRQLLKNVESADCYDVTLPANYSQSVFERFYREALIS